MSELSTMMPLLFFGQAANTLVVIVGVGLLIFVHELGHFLVAKWNKVRVEAFSLGFGPELFGFTRGGTRYKVCVVPLGGYVKMAGGDSPTAEYESDDPAEFPNKPIPARIAVICAGVAMNAIIGLLLFVLAFNLGVPLTAPVVGEVTPGLPAWSAGIRPGDTILRINGNRILDFEDILHEIALSEGPVDVVVRRDGKEIAFRDLTPVTDSRFGVRLIGVGQALKREIHVEEGSPAFEAGLRTGDRIVTVAGRADQQRYKYALARAEGPVPFVVRRGDETLTFEVAPKFGPLQESPRPLVGITQIASRIAAVRPGSPAEEAGFRADDTIVAVDGAPVVSFQQALRRLEETAPAQATFTVRRADGDVSVGPVAVEGGDRGWSDFFDDVVENAPEDDSTAVSLMDDRSFAGGNPSRAAGLVEGARIRTVNGTKVSTFKEIQETIAASPKGEPVRISWSAPGSEEVTGPVAVVRKSRQKPIYGISFQEQSTTVKVSGLLDASREGLRRSYRMGRRVVQMLTGIITGRVSAKNLGGPIMIFQLSYRSAERNFVHFLYFLGMLSINLAILNILPIPVLDGGHLVFLILEAIRRRPLSERSMAMAQWAGLLFLLLLMAYVVTQDVSRLFG